MFHMYRATSVYNTVPIMHKNDFFELLEKYLRGECTPKELEHIEEFYNSFDEDPDRWDFWDLTTHERIKLDIYRGFKKRISQVPVRLRSQRNLYITFRIAASILLIGGLTYALYWYSNREQVEMITYTASIGERLIVELNDGSIVQLNAESMLQVPSKFAANSRNVQLDGEAFFVVAKDPEKPFTVKTSSVLTTVLGTEFNISAYPQKNILVTVATGKVSVASSPSIDVLQGQQVILLPEQQAEFDIKAGKLSSRKADLEKYLGWTKEMLVLDEMAFGDVAEILERWYNVEIEFENPALANCQISGKYKFDKHLSNILESLKFLKGIDYTINERNITISGKACE